MSYCRLSDADIYLYEDNEGVVCFGKNGHQAWGMTKKEAIEHVNQHRRDGDYVPEYVDSMLRAEYIDELVTKLASLEAENTSLRERARWIPVGERLPEVIEKDGMVNSVFVKYKAEYAPDCGSEYSVSNTVYLSLHPDRYESWKYPELPEAPKEDAQ